MAKIELLTHQTHQQLKVMMQGYATHECGVSSVMVVPSELPLIQREYPVFFRKNPETGDFYPSVMLGFTADENVFIKEEQWLSSYVPMMLCRGPFLIGFQDQGGEGQKAKTPVIYIDVDDERVNTESGEAIFAENGERSPYLEKISHVLTTIHHGVEQAKSMVAAFSEFELIESVDLGVEFKNGKKTKLAGLYTINVDTLSKLDGAALAKLNQHGFLNPAFCIANSLNNIQALIDIKNQTL